MTMPEPAPVWKGRAAIYERDDGSAVLAYRAESEDEDTRQVIPAALWQMLGAAARGERIDMSPAKLARLLLGR